MASVDDYLANKRKRAEQKFTYQKKLKVAKLIIFNGAVKENELILVQFEVPSFIRLMQEGNYFISKSI